MTGSRWILALLACLAGAPTSAQRTISTDDPEPVFVASGEPRADFGRAYVPDNGRDGDVFARDLGYLGIGFEEYVSLNDGNISSLLRDDDFVAVLPPALLANPNFAYMLEGGFFAFRPGLDGLEAVGIATPDGRTLAARDLGPMTETRPVVGADADRTVLIADDPLPREGLVGFGLFNMRTDTALLRRIVAKNGLALGASSLVTGAEAEARLRQDGNGLMFMAASQGDPALAGILSDPDVEIFAATNFGLVPVRVAASPEGGPAVAAPGARPAAEPEPEAAEVAAAPPEAEPAPAAKAEPYRPPEPVDLETDLARTDEVILVVPHEVDPAGLDRVTLVWRLSYDRTGARLNPTEEDRLHLTRVTPFLSLTDHDRIEGMLAQVRAALPEARVRADGPFNDLDFEGRYFDPQIRVNLTNGNAGLAIPLQMAVDGNYAAALDGGWTYWTLRDGELRRVRRLSPPYAEVVAFEDLDDRAMVILSPAGLVFDTRGEYLGGGKRTEPMRYNLPSFVHLERGGETVEAVDFLDRNTLDPYFVERAADAMILPLSAFERDPIRFDLDRGILAEEKFFILQAGDLRHPSLAPLLAARGVDLNLRAVRRTIPIERGAVPEVSMSAAMEAHRAERLARNEELGGVLALPAGGGEIEEIVVLDQCRQQPPGLGLRDGEWTFIGGSEGAFPMRNLVTEAGCELNMVDDGVAARVFAEPGVAVLLPAVGDERQRALTRGMRDVSRPVFDPLFDGGRRFVTIRGNAPADMPAAPEGG